MQRNDPRTVAQWRQRLDRFESTQLSLTAFCKSEGVTASAFYYWRRKLGRPAASNQRRRSVQHPSFLPVEVGAPAEVEFTFPGGATLRLSPGDPQLLKTVIDSIVRCDVDRGDG